MPSLLDMFQPQNAAGEPVGFGDAGRSNSLIGLGLGLLSPSNPLRGQSSWGQGLEGFQEGAKLDARTATAAAQLQHQKRQEAFQRSQAAQAQSNFERQFARGDVTDAQRAMADVLGPSASPEQKADFMKNYYASKTDPGAWILKDIVDPNDPEQKITVQEHNRTGQIRPPVWPGQTGAAPAQADPFAPGATPRPVYGQGGDFSTPPAAPAGGVPGQPQQRTRPGITGASGTVYTPPAGLNKKGYEAWQNHVATTEADVASGKMTEAQGTSNLYAGKMAIANSMLDPETEKQGLDATGNRLEKYGGWAGNVMLMPKEYQKYRDAKDTFLNAYLRRISGATVHDAEYLREEKVFFPQPGDPPAQVEYKRRLRDDAISRMKQQVGPGYKEPPAAPSSAPGPDKGQDAAENTGRYSRDAIRQELIRRGLPVD